MRIGVRPILQGSALGLAAVAVTALYVRYEASAPRRLADDASDEAVSELAAVGSEDRVEVEEHGTAREHVDPTRDLAAMSETFRNSTLLIAIRDAGFVCDAVVAAHHSADGLWMASCGNLSGYRVDVHESGRLVATPIAHYFDGLNPSPQRLQDDRFRLDREAPMELPGQRPQR